MRWSVRTGWILVLLAPSVASVWAQQSSGGFTGILTDAKGGRIPGATVTAIQGDKKIVTDLNRRTIGSDGQATTNFGSRTGNRLDSIESTD